MISNLRVNINNFAPTAASEVDVVLFGPSGAHSIIFTNRITASVTGRNYTFQTGATPLPTSGGPASGTYDVAGTTYSGLGTPSAVTNTGLGVFNGTDPNGTWSLFVFDDVSGDGGSIGSWSLEFTTGAAATTFSWSPSDFLDFTNIANPLAENVTSSTLYTVTAGAANGCTASGQVQLTAGAPLVAGINGPASFEVVRRTADQPHQLCERGGLPYTYTGAMAPTPSAPMPTSPAMWHH